MSTVTDPAGGLTRYERDRADRPTPVTDPKNLSTVYTRNGFGDVIRTDSPDTGTATQTYGPAGNLVGRVDARGVQASYAYDALNRVTRAGFAGEDYTYAYDTCANGIGRLCSVTEPGGMTAYQYDIHGRIVRVTRTTGLLNFVTDYSYAGAGRLTAITTPAGRVIRYDWLSGEIRAVAVDGQPLLASIHRAPFGPVAGWTWGNGQPSQRAFDLDGRIVQNDSLPSLATDLVWDAADRITEIADVTGSQQFGYDLLDRLTTAGGLWGSQGFAYDGVGNRTGKTEPAGATQYAYGATSHRLESEIGPVSRSYQYDAAGNLAADGTHTYAHDGRGRLIRVEAGGVTVATYTYDAEGRRVTKQTGAEGERHYAYDEGGRLLGEYDAQGAALREYVWLDDLPVGVIDPPEVPPQTGTLRFVHADHLGTPRRISDPATNRVIWSWGGAPFGETPADEDPDGDGIPYRFNLRFPGQYFDAEAGRHYNGFRDYDPRTGRYIQSDPIGFDGGINTYAYVADNPLRFIDPFGLAYFAKRPLAGWRWLGPASCNPIDDFFDTEVSHEQIFFEDGKSPTNIGFFDDG